MAVKDKNRQLAVLVLGMFFMTLGFSIIMPILPYYSQKMGASALELGLLMASYSAMQLIVTPFWGDVSDRIGRKPVFLIGLFGYGFSFIIYGIATQLWMLFAARMLGGILSGGLYPASLAYIADITEHRERGQTMGLLGAASGLGMVFGPSISGVLSIWGLAAPFFATAAFALLFGILGYFLLKESRSVDVHHPVRREKVSLVAPLRSPIAALFILSLVVTFLISGFQSMFAYYMMGRFGLTDQPSPMPVLDASWTLTGPAAVAALFTVMGVAGVFCQGFLVGPFIRRFGEGKTILAGLAMSAAAFFSLAAAPELVTVLLFSSLMVMGTGLATPCLNSLVSKNTGEDRQGAALGVLGSYGAMGRIVGGPVAGLAFDINIYLPYVISGIVSLLGAISMGRVLNRKRRATEPDK